MKYTAPSFTVQTGHRPADSCSHGWLDVRGRCVFCGHERSPAGSDAKRETDGQRLVEMFNDFHHRCRDILLPGSLVGL